MAADLLNDGVCGVVVGATVGFLGGAVAALAPATMLGVSTEAWATLAICGTSMQWGEKIGKGEEMTVGSMLLDAGVNTFLAPFFLNPATQIPALWVSGGVCTGMFGYACYIGDGEMAGESLVGAAASFGTILRIPQTVGKRSDAQRLANELTNALNRGTESMEYLRSLVFACAAERYNELPDNSLQYQVDKLRERMESGETERTLSAKLLETAVRSIRITDAENITLELVNGQIIAKEAAKA